jgi:hypothetical protein
MRNSTGKYTDAEDDYADSLLTIKKIHQYRKILEERMRKKSLLDLQMKF